MFESVYIYICIYMLVDQKMFKSYLVIDTPFQTFAVGLLVKFID